ncbi:hypothetical protein [Actinocorallia longicatena]|uniref:Uncharacterized protein n=1 Tax=Actinocorallia longicatena TaxID=111803 RepID=A0ABP6QF60_9ACTN
MNIVERARADLKLVGECWPALQELLDPQAWAPRQPSFLTAEQRAELDYQARIEQWERIDVAPGAHRDAARAEFIDLTAAIRAEAYEVADTIAWALIRPPWLPHTRPRQSIDHHLEFAHRHFGQVTDLLVSEWVVARARDMAAQCGRALALAYDGQTLKTVCPWCKGGLAGTPSLRVRILPHGDIAVICESDIPCEPPSRKTGTWWKGRPAWAFQDWTWLAKELHRDDDRKRKTG